MILESRRQRQAGGGCFSDLSIDGVPAGHILENDALKIPVGTFPIIFTVSGRAQQGTLWCPAQETDPLDKEKWVLPLLLNVPNRTAIRIHAANIAAQLIGCLAPGRTVEGHVLRESRAELTDVMTKMAAAYARGEHVSITITEEFEEAA